MLLLLQFSKNVKLFLGLQTTIPNLTLKHLDNQSTLH